MRFELTPAGWKPVMLTITPMVPIRDVERKLFKWISSFEGDLLYPGLFRYTCGRSHHPCTTSRGMIFLVLVLRGIISGKPHHQVNHGKEGFM